MNRISRVLIVGCGAIALLVTAFPASAATPFLSPLNRVSVIASTVPGNGDVNPYGVAVVHRSTGLLHKNSVLVSNFNAASNLQGTGTTIVQRRRKRENISPA